MITKYRIFENVDIQSIKNFAYEYAKDNHPGLNSYEDAVEELDYFFNYEIPRFGEYIKLIRVLGANSKEDIDTDILGIHYLPEYNKEYIYDESWYDKIGLDWEENNVYLVEVKTNVENVDWKETINNRLSYPREYEITLFNENILNITKISKINTKRIK